MASTDESSRKRLPFEPKKRKVEVAQSAPKAFRANDTIVSQREQAKSKKKAGSGKAQENAIPEVVSRRMLKRMMIFSGLPTFAGVLTFFVSYFLLVNEVVDLPSYFVLFATLGCFGLGVLGLSYGALSASWDEERLGHWLGFDEFKVNFGRLTGAWNSKSND